MMRRTKRRTRSYSAGERGRNRVRVFEDPKTGVYQMEWREGGKRGQQSLGHRDFDRAKRQADAMAVELAVAKPADAEPEPEPLTLGQLFEMYLEEVTPTKSERTRGHDKRALSMFEAFLGADREPSSLSKRDWDRFIQKRRAGDIGASGRPVSDRTVECDLRTLMAVLNWAEKSKDDSGAPLVDRNPFRGLTPPKEKNPRRVILTEEEYQALLGVAEGIDWRFRVALVLAHETGHRIGAVRQLRWSDVDLEDGLIRWRAQTEKTGYEHVTPITEGAQEALRAARARNPGIGDAPVLPAPQDSAECASRYLMRDWWKRAEVKAKLEPKPGRGWHSLRRKFASDLMETPLKVLCQLGGWKTHQTVVECYQRADEAQLREALEARRRA